MKLSKADQYIRKIELKRDELLIPDKYPFNLPALENFDSLELHPNVTFLVGENGTGKSTLLEAIAVACGFNPEGGTKNFNFTSMDTHSELNRYLRIVRGPKRIRDGFFLRAESFYNLATNIEELDSEGGSPRIIDSYGGVSLHSQSHGESFFSVFINRFSGKGLYILDEPEAALSPSRQMSMLTRIHELVNEESQIIIATHSPILMAYPEARIYEVRNGFEPKAYEETDHYKISRAFLDNRQKMLDILLE